MKHTDIYDILNGKVGLGQTVTVCGWVRTFRDSATVAFLEVADGTSFSRLQAVVDKNAVALDSECAKNGASVCIKGEIVKAYKGNGVELNAREVEKAHNAGILARHSASAPSHQHLHGGVPRAFGRSAGHSPLFSREQILLYEHAHHHGKRLRGRGRNVPRYDAAVLSHSQLFR